MSAADALKRARTRLLLHGWVQEANKNRSGYTISEALMGRGLTAGADELEAIELVKAHLRVADLDDWNRHPQRHKDDVIEVISEVADAIVLDLTRVRDKVSPEAFRIIAKRLPSLAERIKALDKR